MGKIGEKQGLLFIVCEVWLGGDYIQTCFLTTSWEEMG